jgi:hypothetical protein
MSSPIFAPEFPKDMDKRETPVQNVEEDLNDA